MAAPPTDPAAMEQALYWYPASYTVPSYAIVAWGGALLSGAIVMQCADYLNNSRGDSRLLKVMACTTTFMQLLSSVFEITGNFIQIQLAIDRKISPFMSVPWTNGLIIFTSVTSGLISQAYFGRLVWRMTRTSANSRKWSLPWAAVFILLALSVGACGYASFAYFMMIPKRSWHPEFYAVVLVGSPINFYRAWLVCAATLDVTLSAILITNFVRDIRKDGFAKTNSILTSLAVCTLETFSLTASIAIIDLAFALLFGHETYVTTTRLEITCYSLTVLIERAYAASFLFTLKRHARVRNARNNESSGHKSFSNNAASKNAGRYLRTPGGTALDQSGAAIELRSGAFGDSGHSYVDGVHVQTTMATQIEDGISEDFKPAGRQHVVDWSANQEVPEKA